MTYSYNNMGNISHVLFKIHPCWAGACARLPGLQSAVTMSSLACTKGSWKLRELERPKLSIKMGQGPCQPQLSQLGGAFPANDQAPAICSPCSPHNASSPAFGQTQSSPFTGVGRVFGLAYRHLDKGLAAY